MRLLPECCAYISLLPDQNDGMHHYITGESEWWPKLSEEDVVLILALKGEGNTHFLVKAIENIVKATGSSGNKLFQLPKDDDHKLVEDLMNYMLSRYQDSLAYAIFKGKRYTRPSDLHVM
jgi:hypothetical protein